MSPKEAYEIVVKECEDGIAYSSRMGDYGSKERFYEMIDAIHVLREDLRDRKTVDRKLFSSLFIIGNQVEGSVHGALAKNIEVPEWLWDEGIVALNEALWGVFEDA